MDGVLHFRLRKTYAKKATRTQDAKAESHVANVQSVPKNQDGESDTDVTEIQ